MALRSRRFEVEHIAEWDGDPASLKPAPPAPPAPPQRKPVPPASEPTGRAWTIAFAVMGLLLAFSLLRFVMTVSAPSDSQDERDAVELTVRARLAPPPGESLPEALRVHLVFPDIPYEVEGTPAKDGSVEIPVSVLSERPAGRFHLELSHAGKRWRVVSDQLVSGGQEVVDVPVVEVEEPPEPRVAKRPARQRAAPAPERSRAGRDHRDRKAARKVKRGDRSP